MAWFNDQWVKLKEGAKLTWTGTRERVRNFRWRNLSKPVLIWTGSIVGVLLVGWIALNILLAGMTLIFGTLRVANFAHGSFYMIAAYLSFTLARATLDELIAKLTSFPEAVAAGKIKPSIDRTMPMSELKAAYAHMGSRGVMGKLVMVN